MNQSSYRCSAVGKPPLPLLAAKPQRAPSHHRDLGLPNPQSAIRDPQSAIRN
jgi:hypothetical protein